MKIKIRPDDTSMLQDNDWLHTDGWLAGLRDDGRAAAWEGSGGAGGYLPVRLPEPGWHR